jgi:Rrf2 family protein
MFSQTAEYALRAVVWLAQHYQTGPIGNRTIAEVTRIPPSYLSKILHDLAQAEILCSRRGVGGGFQLIPSPDELTILDVINAVDPWKRITGCPLGLNSHCDRLCPVHARLDDTLGLVEEALANSTIREVMFDPDRPLPLSETLGSRPGLKD